MHANARLTPIGRLTMVMRIESGRPVAHVAAEMGISRPTAYKWWHRWDELGAVGLVDRSEQAPVLSPPDLTGDRGPDRRAPPHLEARSCPHRLPVGSAVVHCPPGADPARDQPTVMDGPTHRSGDP